MIGDSEKKCGKIFTLFLDKMRCFTWTWDTQNGIPNSVNWFWEKSSVSSCEKAVVTCGHSLNAFLKLWVTKYKEIFTPKVRDISVVDTRPKKEVRSSMSFSTRVSVRNINRKKKFQLRAHSSFDTYTQVEASETGQGGPRVGQIAQLVLSQVQASNRTKQWLAKLKKKKHTRLIPWWNTWAKIIRSF